MGMIELRQFDPIANGYMLHTRIVPGESDFDMKIVKDDTGDLCLDIHVPYVVRGDRGVRVVVDSHLAKEIFKTMMSDYSMMIVVCHNRYWAFAYDEALWEHFPEWIRSGKRMTEGAYMAEYVKNDISQLMAMQYVADHLRENGGNNGN